MEHIYQNWHRLCAIFFFNPLPHNDTFWYIKDILLWKTLWEKEKLLVTSNFSFFHNVFYHYIALIFSSTGRRPASLCHGPLSVVRLAVCLSVRASVCALTFSLNIFFAETTYRILMKFLRNVPTMVLFRISWNNLILSKTLVAMATKLKIFWNLWKSSCQKP